MKDFCFRVEETQVNQLHASTGRGALIDIHLRRTKTIRNDDVLFSQSQLLLVQRIQIHFHTAACDCHLVQCETVIVMVMIDGHKGDH